MKKMENKRVRAFSLVTYLETQEEVLQALNNINDLQKFAFISHDKDNSSKHFHVALITANAHTLTAISKYFKNTTTSTNVFIEPLVSPKGIYTYFTHEEEEEEKHKYDVKDIVTNDSDFFATADYVNDVCVDIIESILQGLLTHDLVKMFGKHFCYNYNNFVKIANRIVYETRQNKCLLDGLPTEDE